MPPAPLTVSPTSATLTVGDTLQLTVSPASGVKWYCTVCHVATVSSTGLVTAYAAGVTQIIALRANQAVTVTITVDAAPAPPAPSPDPCTCTVTPSTSAPTAAGDSASLTITASAANCPWTATVDVPWISLVSATSGVGSGTLAYLVAANASTSVRVGVITVAGQICTITQAGSIAPPPDPPPPPPPDPEPEPPPDPEPEPPPVEPPPPPPPPDPEPEPPPPPTPDPLVITTVALLPAYVNTAYSMPLSSSGGTGTITWSLVTPVPNLSISGSALVGMPTTIGSTPITIRATDSATPPQITTKPFTFVVSQPSNGNAYFAYWQAQAACVYSRSLRSQAEINALGGSTVPTHWVYPPPSGSPDGVQLISQFLVNGGWNIPGTSQLNLNLQSPTRFDSAVGNMVVVWDWWWGPEFRDNCGDITHYKTWQWQTGNKGWWTLYNSQGAARNYVNAGGDPAVVSFRFEAFRAGQGSAGTAGNPIPMYSPNPLSHTGVTAYPGDFPPNGLQQQYPVHHSVWTRYWIEMKLYQPHDSAFAAWNAHYGSTLQSNPNLGADSLPRQTWTLINMWTADETRGPERVLRNMPINWGLPTWGAWPGTFKFEMNSSKEGATGPLVAFGRNFFVLRNYVVDESDTTLFQPPVP